MKKTLMGVSALLILALTFTLSCKKTHSDVQPQKEVTASASETSSVAKFYIYYATWDEWGRTSRSCAGWGLCNYVDCWFCCVDEKDNIVSCKDNVKVTMSGKAVINAETNEGFMYIRMDPSDAQQAEAIKNASVLYVDQDITGERFTVLAGDYQFDPSIGENGGYAVNVKGK